MVRLSIFNKAAPAIESWACYKAIFTLLDACEAFFDCMCRERLKTFNIYVYVTRMTFAELGGL